MFANVFVAIATILGFVFFISAVISLVMVVKSILSFISKVRDIISWILNLGGNIGQWVDGKKHGYPRVSVTIEYPDNHPLIQSGTTTHHSAKKIRKLVLKHLK